MTYFIEAEVGHRILSGETFVLVRWPSALITADTLSHSVREINETLSADWFSAGKMWFIAELWLIVVISIHSFIHHLWPLILQRDVGSWNRSQLTLGEGKGTVWTDRQFITGLLYFTIQYLKFFRFLHRVLNFVWTCDHLADQPCPALPSCFQIWYRGNQTKSVLGKNRFRKTLITLNPIALL